MAAISSAIALGVSAVSTVKGMKDAKDASKAQKQSNEAQRKITRLKNMQAKRGFLRQFRNVQSDAVMAGIGAGVDIGSSTVQGQLASSRTQAETSVREFGQMDDLGAEMTSAMNRASNKQYSAGVASAVGGFASGFVDYGAIKGIFKS